MRNWKTVDGMAFPKKKKKYKENSLFKFKTGLHLVLHA